MAHPEVPVGARGRTNAAFRDEDGNPADPTTVLCRYRRPDGTEGTATFGVEPIIKTGVGLYHYDVVIDQPGRWVFRWEGSGALVAATPDIEVDCLRSALT